ncbi:MAG: hypothetical protein IPL61_36025 [Myxococcales bacterium]|nr:hypothetical protein [Myxococcales bacterium]
MSVDRELLARWRTLVARRDPEAAEGWEDEPSPYFLHSFRPDGAGLEELFVDMPHGEEVLARLRAVFKAGDATSGHAYLVPRKAPLATRAQLRGWAQGYLEALAQIARAVDATGPGALALTEGGLEVEVEVGLAPEETEASEMRTVVYELVTDFGHSLTPASAHGDLLDEPLYCLANDYALAFYVLWPQLAASASATVADPFAPYFELWRHQATLRYASGGVQVYVPARARGGQVGERLTVGAARRRRPRARRGVGGAGGGLGRRPDAAPARREARRAG